MYKNMHKNMYTNIWIFFCHENIHTFSEQKAKMSAKNYREQTHFGRSAEQGLARMMYDTIHKPQKAWTM